MKNLFNVAVLILLAAVLLWLWRLQASIADQPVRVSRTDSVLVYLYDTTPRIIERHFLPSAPVAYAPPASRIDSAAVVRDYYTKRLVVDSLLDSLLCIHILDTLYKNGIAYRKYQYKLLKPYQVEKRITTTIETTKPAAGLYAGPFYSFGKSYRGAGAEIDYVTKRFTYGLGGDLLNKSLTGKVLIKLSK